MRTISSILSYLTSSRDRPPVLLFDYDGVIADSLEIYFQEFSRACAELGYQKLNSRATFLQLFDGNPVRRLVRAGFPIRKLHQLASEFKPKIEAANRRIKPFPGIIETISELTQHHPAMIITTNHSELGKQFIRQSGLTRITAVIGSDSEISKIRKIRRARRQFPAYRPYYIGDTKGDMIEAGKAGAVSVGVGWGWHELSRLQAGGADHLVRDQAELLALFNRQLETAAKPRAGTTDSGRPRTSRQFGNDADKKEDN